MTSNRTHRRRTPRLLAAPAVALTGLVAFAGAAAAVPSGNGVAPTYVAGNPSCADIAPGGATWIEAKLDFDPAAGDYTRGDLEISIDKSDAGLEWTTDGDVAAVIMKGGPNANVYAYPGVADTHDTGLRPPTNPNSKDGKDYGISHVTFCVGAGTPEITPAEPEKPAEPEVPVTPATPVVPETPAPAAAEVQAAEAAPEVQAQVLGVTLEAPAELPRTGVETSLLAAIGVLLLAAGGVLVALAGRPAAETTTR